MAEKVAQTDMTQAATGNSASPATLAEELRPLLARNAAKAEHGRRLPEENVQALEAANLFKIMTPGRWGGYGAPLTIAIRTFAELGKGCGSTGWVAMIVNGINWWASLLPDAGQEEIFVDSHARVCAAGTQASKGKRVDGGIRVSGKFPFASGCWHASWGGLSVEIEDDAHRVVDAVTAFAPISELRIEDTWYVAGMCGTGSNTLVADEIFVPNHRLLRLSNLLTGEHQGVKHKGEFSDSYTWSAANTLIGPAPIIGIAQAMLAEVIAAAPRRGISFTTYARQADSPVIQHHLAEAALNIETADLHLMSSAEQVESFAAAGKLMDYPTRARIRGSVGYAAKVLREAADILASIGGASGFAETSPLQRMWRDVNVATRHALLATDPAFEIYGRALLGVEGNISPLI
jgi:3-hydroxy-9,10-secoandrosta-1,3,5(10)-triene-9,17-dione monooxygenase